jgi:hypothetical protein
VYVGWGGHEAKEAGEAEAVGAGGGEPLSASPRGGGWRRLRAYGTSRDRRVAAFEPAGFVPVAAGRQRPALMPLPRRAYAFAMPCEVP